MNPQGMVISTAFNPQTPVFAYALPFCSFNLISFKISSVCCSSFFGTFPNSNYLNCSLPTFFPAFGFVSLISIWLLTQVSSFQSLFYFSIFSCLSLLFFHSNLHKHEIKVSYYFQHIFGYIS